MAGIAVNINGEQRTVSASSVKELIEELSLAGRKVAVELNRKLVARDDFSQTKLVEGDKVEIVQFVGGG